MMKKQDMSLGILEEGVDNLNNMANGIHDEIQQQDKLLDTLDTDVSDAQNRLNQARDKMQALMKTTQVPILDDYYPLHCSINYGLLGAVLVRRRVGCLRRLFVAAHNCVVHARTLCVYCASPFSDGKRDASRGLFSAVA